MNTTMVKIGRVIINEAKVVSVQRCNGTGNPLETVITMDGGKVHTFSDHAQAAWEHFKQRATYVA